MMNWHDTLPSEVARAQEAWDRVRQIRRMQFVGMTQKQIARHLAISAGRVSQLSLKGKRDEEVKLRAPIERYFKMDDDLREIRFAAREIERRQRYMLVGV